MIVKEQWEELLQLDELNRELSSGRVLNDFHALQPTFPPTFKRIRHKDIHLFETKEQIESALIALRLIISK